MRAIGHEGQAGHGGAGTARVTLRLDVRTDSDILDALGSQPDRQGYIKRLIREDLARREVMEYTGGAVANPYEAPGCAGTPSVLVRCMPTPGRLAETVRQTESYRHLTTDDVACASGVDREAVGAIETGGAGTLGDVTAVLEAIGVEPVTLPGELICIGGQA